MFDTSDAAHYRRIIYNYCVDVKWAQENRCGQRRLYRKFKQHRAFYARLLMKELANK